MFIYYIVTYTTYTIIAEIVLISNIFLKHWVTDVFIFDMFLP